MGQIKSKSFSTALGSLSLITKCTETIGQVWSVGAMAIHAVIKKLFRFTRISPMTFKNTHRHVASFQSNGDFITIVVTMFAQSMSKVLDFGRSALLALLKLSRPLGFFHFSMKSSVISKRHNHKIVNRVIGFISIYMMNNHICFQRMTKMFFHNVSMFRFPTILELRRTQANIAPVISVFSHTNSIDKLVGEVKC